MAKSRTPNELPRTRGCCFDARKQHSVLKLAGTTGGGRRHDQPKAIMAGIRTGRFSDRTTELGPKRGSSSLSRVGARKTLQVAAALT
jgi:hypothetical protein